jgi:hypothetical protein
LSYQWSINDEPQPSASGLGKSILSFTGDQLNAQESVAVDVYLGATRAGHGEITIVATQPQILLYYKDPLRGVVWDQALPQGIALGSKEITLQAEPYYFAASQFPAFSWTLNGEDTSGPQSAQGVLTLRQTGSGSGTALLGVSAQNNNVDQFVQSAEAALQFVFGQQSSSIFGL